MANNHLRILCADRSSRVLLAIILIGLLSLFAACAVEDPANLTPYITDLRVVETDGVFHVEIEGELPYGCAEFQEISQEVSKKTITITMKAAVPEGESCSRLLTKFKENITLNTTELDPGLYVLDVHNILADLIIP